MNSLEIRAATEMFHRGTNDYAPLWVDALRLVAPASYDAVESFVKRHQWQCDRYVLGLREAVTHRQEIYVGQMGQLQYNGDEHVSVHGKRYACQAIETPDPLRTAKDVIRLLVQEITGSRQEALEQRIYSAVAPPHWEGISSYIRQARETINSKWDAVVRMKLQNEQTLGSVQAVLYARPDAALEQLVIAKHVDEYVHTIYEELGRKAAMLPKYSDMQEIGCAAFRFARDYTPKQLLTAMYDARDESGMPLWSMFRESDKAEILRHIKTRPCEIIKELFFPIHAERSYIVAVEYVPWKGKKEAQLRAFIGGKT